MESLENCVDGKLQRNKIFAAKNRPVIKIRVGFVLTASFAARICRSPRRSVLVLMTGTVAENADAAADALYQEFLLNMEYLQQQELTDEEKADRRTNAIMRFNLKGLFMAARNEGQRARLDALFANQHVLNRFWVLGAEYSFKCLTLVFMKVVVGEPLVVRQQEEFEELASEYNEDDNAGSLQQPDEEQPPSVEPSAGGNGGIPFKAGSNRDTVGIMVWPEVFWRELKGEQERILAKTEHNRERFVNEALADAVNTSLALYEREMKPSIQEKLSGSMTMQAIETKSVTAECNALDAFDEQTSAFHAQRDAINHRRSLLVSKIRARFADLRGDNANAEADEKMRMMFSELQSEYATQLKAREPGLTSEEDLERVISQMEPILRDDYMARKESALLVIEETLAPDDISVIGDVFDMHYDGLGPIFREIEEAFRDRARKNIAIQKIKDKVLSQEKKHKKYRRKMDNKLAEQKQNADIWTMIGRLHLLDMELRHQKRIISIMGPARTGKSFLLAYLAKQFSDQNGKVLRGNYRTGDVRHTEGILIRSQPIRGKNVINVQRQIGGDLLRDLHLFTDIAGTFPDAKFPKGDYEHASDLREISSGLREKFPNRTSCICVPCVTERVGTATGEVELTEAERPMLDKFDCLLSHLDRDEIDSSHERDLIKLGMRIADFLNTDAPQIPDSTVQNKELALLLKIRDETVVVAGMEELSEDRQRKLRAAVTDLIENRLAQVRINEMKLLLNKIWNKYSSCPEQGDIGEKQGEALEELRSKLSKMGFSNGEKMTILEEMRNRLESVGSGRQQKAIELASVRGSEVAYLLM
ncbi:unnamed protein product, partial [Mesorhabditis spiculigera]